MTNTQTATPCDAGVHVLCCHDCVCDCHTEEPS